MKKPFVSVVIPALNSEKTIKACLNAIKNLNFPKDKTEVIVMDNGSKDKTLEIAKEFKARIFVKPQLSIGELRNFGTKQAKGSILAFIDSDVIVPRNWLSNGLPCLNRKEIAMAGSPYKAPKDASWIAKTWELLRSRKEVKKINEVDWLPAGNMLIKKVVFNKLKGFSSIKTSEDVDLGLRAWQYGYKVISDNKLGAVHLTEGNTIYQFMKKRIWQSSSLIDLFLRHKRKLRRIIFLSLYHLTATILLVISIIPLLINKDGRYLMMALAILILPSIISALGWSAKRRAYRYIPAVMVVRLLGGISYSISIILHKQWRYLRK